VGVGLRAITYYNDALIRTDVYYEQLAQYSGKIKSKSDRIEREELQDLAIKHGSKNDLIVPSWKRVRNDVNIIKHQSIHTTEGPAINPENTLRVIEQLIKGVKSVFHKQYGESPSSFLYYLLRNGMV
jgi:hypothetical protein